MVDVFENLSLYEKNLGGLFQIRFTNETDNLLGLFEIVDFV